MPCFSPVKHHAWPKITLYCTASNYIGYPEEEIFYSLKQQNVWSGLVPCLKKLGWFSLGSCLERRTGKVLTDLTGTL